MSDVPKEPTNRELLERLSALEAENAKLIDRVASLEARAGNTHSALIRLMQQVGELIHESVILDGQVWELMEKIFPGHKKTHWQILNIFHRDRKADPQEGQPR